MAALFGWAASLDPGDRSSLLEIACGEDRSLREEVDALLRADAACHDDHFLRCPIGMALDELRHSGQTPAS